MTSCFFAKFLLALAGLGFVLSASTADAGEIVYIGKDYGGNVGQYAEKYTAWRKTGKRVVINGSCMSACTIVVALIPRAMICVARNASLAFHGVSYSENGKIDKERSIGYFRKYPADFQSWFERHRPMDGPKMKVMKGRELEELIQRCPEPYYSGSGVPSS